jgi:hypothetical protein
MHPGSQPEQEGMMTNNFLLFIGFGMQELLIVVAFSTGQKKSLTCGLDG